MPDFSAFRSCIVLALTGSIYLFKPQIDAFADREWIR